MATRYQRHSDDVNVASGINLLAGLWLIVSPWVYGHAVNDGSVWNSVVVGIVIALIAAARMAAGVRNAGLSWVNAILGAWMIVSPWVYGYAGDVPRTWNSVIVGVIVLVLAIAAATAGDTYAGEYDYERGWGGPGFWGWGYPPYGYYGGARPGTYWGGEADRWGGRGYWGGEYRGRGPRGYQRADDLIRNDVCERMSDDPYLDASDIEVSVASGEVTLEGTVGSRHAKRLAEDIADSVGGVRDVHNMLRVSEPGAPRDIRRAA